YPVCSSNLVQKFIFCSKLCSRQIILPWPCFDNIPCEGLTDLILGDF
ncbi:hypothetical protein A2U01_0093122, partial [Trifolium medium]|nr:hypothetical protein [Trifolium medium]